MIEMKKGYKVGDMVLFFKISPHTKFKNIFLPFEVEIQEINTTAIGDNHTIIGTDVTSKITYRTHENHLYREDERDKLMGMYYRAISSAGNSIPSKIRKAIKKYSDKYPEYSI